MRRDFLASRNWPLSSSLHHPAPQRELERTMDVLDTDLGVPSGPVPPAYDLSQQEYESKTSRAVLESRRLADMTQPSRSPAGSPAYGNYDNANYRLSHIRTQSLAPSPANATSSPTRSSQSRPPSAALRTAGSLHHRQNSISSSSGNSSNTAASAAASSSGHAKERPAWYAEAGLGNASSPQARPSPRPPTSSSSHPTSPVDGPSSQPRIASLLDEEAGIDSPPPPFAPKPPTNSLPITAAFLQPTYASSSSSGYYDAPATGRAGSPQSYYVDAQPPPPSLPTSRHKKRTSSFNWQPEAQVGSSSDPRRGPAAPRLAFDRSLAYNNGNNTLPPGAAPAVNAAALYRYVSKDRKVAKYSSDSLYSTAVASILNTPSQPRSSSSYTPTTYTNSPAPSQFSHQRQPSQTYSTSPLQTPYTASTNLPRPGSAQSNASRANSFDQASTYSHRPPSRSSTTGSVTPGPTPGPPPGARAPVAPTIYRHSYQPESVSFSPTTPQGQPSLYAYATTNTVSPNRSSSSDRWVPPGAAAAANVYQRRF